MIIDFDATPLLGNLTGIGVYTSKLMEGMASLEEVEMVRAHMGARVALAKPWAINRILEPRKITQKCDQIRYKFTPKHFASRTLFHGPNFFLPEAIESGIITIHDLSVFNFPETHPIERVKYFERELSGSVRRSSHIVTDSETVRQEVIEYFGLAQDKVTAVHLGVGREFSPRSYSDPSFAPLARYGIKPGEYALCVATMEPRKRIDSAIRAYAEMAGRTHCKVPLVLVGASGWRNGDLQDLVEREATKGTVIPLGYVPPEDLSLLYSGARLFLYLSIYEGFGLPPIEAMASGVPVIVSNRSCLPEVTAGSALLVDPDDIDGCAEAVELAFGDDNWRHEAIQAGLKTAAGYSWELCVEKTVEVYRRSLHGNTAFQA